MFNGGIIALCVLPQSICSDTCPNWKFLPKYKKVSDILREQKKKKDSLIHVRGVPNSHNNTRDEQQKDRTNSNRAYHEESVEFWLKEIEMQNERERE